MILDTDAYIYDAAFFVTNGRTEGRTNKAILGVGFHRGALNDPSEKMSLSWQLYPLQENSK